MPPPENPEASSAFQAAVNSASTTTLSGTVISNPGVALEAPQRFSGNDGLNIIPSTPTPTTTAQVPPEGFILTGTINLFGLGSLINPPNFYSYHGTLAPDLIIPNGESPTYQIVALDHDIRMSLLIPSLKGTAFDQIALKNPTFTYQNCSIDRTKPPGWHFDADIVFDESYGKVHQVLVTLLGIKEPTLHVRCGMGNSQVWTTPLDLNSFTLQGVFAGLTLSPCKGVTLTAIGVELFAYSTTKYAADGSIVKGMAYGFGVLGDLHLDVPGSVTPLELSFEIRDSGLNVQLSADIKMDWKDALGVKGLTLKDVNFSTFLSVNAPLSTFSFDVEAVMQADSTIAALAGSYSAGGDFSLTASFDRLEWTGISDIFYELFGDRLTIADLDIGIGGATLTISSQGGFSLQIRDLTIEQYGAVDGTVQFSSNGATVRASIDGDQLWFEDIQIDKAFAQISFTRAESESSTDVMLGGEISWKGFTFDAGVHLYNTPGEEGLDWTVFGQFKATQGDGLALASLIPELKDSFLKDITLKGAAFIIASKDDPAFGVFNAAGYPAHQGIQLCASIGILDPLNSLMRGQSPTLTLSAGWSTLTGFTLDVLLPTPTTINLGRGITTDPFKLQIQARPPSLSLIAGVKIPVSGGTTPLDFSLILNFDEFGGTATGQLAGNWPNPFGVSPKVVIGPNVALTISIIFEQFVTTGTPSAFGFVGGLKIGKVNAQVAFEINENPSKELLYTEVQNLDINDVVSLASDIIQYDIPQPTNFLTFQDVKLYVCPAGVTIGTIVYPKGFSFISSMTIFGKNADASVIISGSSVSLKGGVDNFTLGPLTVRGTTGPRASASLEISPTKQNGSFDGLMKLYDAEISLNLLFEIMPKPAFSFHFLLHFTDMMTFTVDAAMIGDIANVHDISKVDFTLLAVFHQDILDYIAQQINQQFASASQAKQRDIDADKANVDRAKKALEASIAAAQRALDDAAAKWKAKSNSVHQSFDSIMGDYNAKVKQLQDSLDSATAKYRKDLADAQAKVQEATNNRAEKMKAAQQQVSQAQTDWNNRINNAQHNLDAATQKMNSDFGNAEKKIQDAQGNVNSLQNQINDLQHKIDDDEHASRFDLPKKAALPGLYIARTTLQASQKVATGVLDAATAVLRSQNYLAEQGAMKAATATLAAAKSSGSGAISAAQQAVVDADKASAAVLSAAQDTLTKVQQSGQAAIQASSKALTDFKNARAAIIKAAQDAVDGLIKSGEYLAFQAASNAFAIAKSSTHELDFSQAALDAADKLAGGLLDVAQWIAVHTVTLVNIRDVTLSGQFGHVAAGGGAPIDAVIKGSIAGKDFSINQAFDPRHTADFINKIFSTLWDDVKNGLYKLTS